MKKYLHKIFKFFTLFLIFFIMSLQIQRY